MFIVDYIVEQVSVRYIIPFLLVIALILFVVYIKGEAKEYIYIFVVISLLVLGLLIYLYFEYKVDLTKRLREVIYKRITN